MTYSIPDQIWFIQVQRDNEIECARIAHERGFPSAPTYRQNAAKFTAVLASLERYQSLLGQQEEPGQPETVLNAVSTS